MIMLKKIVIGAICVGAVGCGGAPDAGENATTDDIGSVTQKAESIYLENEYYKIGTGPQIYRLYGTRHVDAAFCWVRDMGMLAALQNRPDGQYDGVSLFRAWDNFNYDRSDAGACHFPEDGFRLYKAKDTNLVYRTIPGGYCHVVDMNQVARLGGQILMINQLSTNLDYSEGGGRPYLGDCQG